MGKVGYAAMGWGGGEGGGLEEKEEGKWKVEEGIDVEKRKEY
jgi:hypothetical protein